MGRRRKKKDPLKQLFFAVFALTALVCVVFGTLIGVNPNAFSMFIVPAIVAASLLILLAVLSLPTVKGKRGEKKISRILQKIAKKNNGYVIDDVIIPDTDNEHTSQLDHVLFTPRGIAVVETKNYAGRIYGNDSQREWTQVLAYGRTKNTLYNPIMQNKTHIYRLRELLTDKSVTIFSCVVFVKGNISYINSDEVCTPSTLMSFCNERLGKEISSEKLQDCYNKVKYYKDNPIQTTKEHVKEIKQMRTNFDKGICPRCGGTLVLRTNKKDGSTFYGCSNYPKCKFIRK